MTIRFLPILLVLLGMALPTAAQTPAQAPAQTANPARFLLESIVVEGVQRDPVREIVAAESLLQPGREYSEQELREAVYRVKRLPFVLDAEFSLRKGGERGNYQLVITVEETRLFFYSVDAGGIYDGDDLRVGPGEERVDWGGSATAGGRWFVGSQGLLFGSVFGFDSYGPSSAQIGYTRYNLFGRGGFASAVVSSDVSNEYDGESYQGSLLMGVPIVGNHSIRADFNWQRSEDEFGSLRSRSEFRNLELSWIYNTTDDPLFPTSGTLLTGGVRYGRSEFEDRGPFFSDEAAADSRGLVLTARRHWALTHRHSVSADLFSAWDETDEYRGDDSSETWRTGLAFGHSMDLWGFEKTERIGDLRWENTLQFVQDDLDSPFFHSSVLEARLVTGLAFRNAWGLVRLTFSYVDNLDREFEPLGFP